MLQVRFLAPNSRWYSGAGIYRNVWLKIYPKVYLPLDGTYVSAIPDSGGYRLIMNTECAGMMTEKTCCHYTLWNDGELAADLGWGKYRMDEQAFMLSVRLNDVKEWDIDSPACYRLRVELFEDNTGAAQGAVSCAPSDMQEVTIGFRRMEFSPEEGFFLNGRKVKVHGVCEHHDLGCLGAAFHKEAMRRKMHILKKMGVNAIRTSHNMPASEFMDLADEMGFLVLSEAFDMWERPKTKYDYSRFFREWAKEDVCSWIRRDRNHPSLFLWSIGNEIYDTHAGAEGLEIARRLIGFVREHDPRENARITIGSNYMPWKGAQNCADLVKIAGYNYGEKYYDAHHKEHPDWIIYGSETASVVHSRGVYRFPLSQPVLADEDEQCSALGNSSTSWGARSLERCIVDDMETEYSFGQFLWTGFDYIGEPTPYHTKNSYFGMVDTAGFPKDAYFVFQAAWTDPVKNPMVHLYPYWDFNEGQMVDVRACTNAASVELFVNGRSCGRQLLTHGHLQGDWRVPYRRGEIMAIAYDREGKEVARQTRHSFGDSVSLTIEPDREVLRGDGEDMCFLTIGAVDSEGYPVENAMDYVTVEVSGCGRLSGMDNGDSTDNDAYKGNVRRLFNGKLLAVVTSKAVPGEIKVSVTAPNLAGAELVLRVEAAPVREGISIREDIIELQDTGKSILPDAQGTGEQFSRQPNPEKRVPVRKIEICAEEGQYLTPGKPSVLVEAKVFPENADDRELIWKAVNTNGIEVGFASVEAKQGGAVVSAIGDGSFLVRCMSKSGTEKVRLISQLEFTAEGFGTAFLNPYGFISAGLFSDTVGEIGNGNEKGIATARDGISGAVYSRIDFGDYGSDEITMPVFALDGNPHRIEIWLGKPGGKESELLSEAVYQKPSVWNVYQEETWKLPRRIKGVADIGFLVHEKLHIKGFTFKKYEKAFSRIDAAECSSIYGDSFRVGEKAVTGIGNNVTITYENMDFGVKGASFLTIWGRSGLRRNTIHVLFTDEGRNTVRRVVEMEGTLQYEPQRVEIEPLTGKGEIQFVFLPGSDFDMEGFQFTSV